MNAVIIGNGTVGKALGKAMGIEPMGPSDDKVSADVVIICVPTETINGKQDLTQVRQAIGRIKDARFVIIRSTVLPKTTELMEQEFGFPCVFVPEFGFEDTMYEDLKSPEYYLIGTTEKSKEYREWVMALLPKSKEYHDMTSTEAELAKYFTNIWGCFQVTMANTLYDWTKSLNLSDDNYEQAVSGATRHKNVPKWGWRIFDRGFRGYSGKCLPKDIKAAISQYPSEVLTTIDNYNNKFFK